jgi:hypothetical protein
MTGSVTVQGIFDAAGLLPCGQVSWGTPIPERSGSVYLIELMQPKDDDGQSIIYVGRTKRSLRRRMREFYNHRYGERRPHRAGQAILKFTPSLLVYWAGLASVFTTLLAVRHSLTRNWPVIALRDCSVAAKSACPPAWG